MFYLSSDPFSAAHTENIIEKILNWLLPAAHENTLAWINYVLRKLAHFLEYGLLAALLFRAFRGDSTMRWRASWVIYSAMVVIAWAVLDEIHQTFTEARHGSVQDVLLNTTGGLVMLLTIALRHGRTYKVESGSQSPS